MKDLPRPLLHARGHVLPVVPQAGGQLTTQNSTALHVKRLVDGLVADAHRLIVREVVP